MSTKLQSRIALAFNLLIFNALVGVIFLLFIPFSLVFYISLGIYKSFYDFISPWVNKNKAIIQKYNQPRQEQQKQPTPPQHNSIGLN